MSDVYGTLRSEKRKRVCIRCGVKIGHLKRTAKRCHKCNPAGVWALSMRKPESFVPPLIEPSLPEPYTSVIRMVSRSLSPAQKWDLCDLLSDHWEPSFIVMRGVSLQQILYIQKTEDRLIRRLASLDSTQIQARARLRESAYKRWISS